VTCARAGLRQAQVALQRGVVLVAETVDCASSNRSDADGQEAVSGGNKPMAERVESFTVRLTHHVDMNRLRAGYTPTLLVHTAALPCRYPPPHATTHHHHRPVHTI
jgi:hypothetical protein